MSQLVATGALTRQDAIEALSAAGHAVGLMPAEITGTVTRCLVAGAQRPRGAAAA